MAEIAHKWLWIDNQMSWDHEKKIRLIIDWCFQMTERVLSDNTRIMIKFKQ
jgi:hypothetical protein